MTAEAPDKVIVSIADEENKFYADVELPTRMAIHNLSKGIVRLLREFEPLKYAGKTSANLWAGDTKLKEDQTLASAGVWDGSVVHLRFRK